METYCQTDVGLKRNSNQDFVYASDQKVGRLPSLLIVADGMGGHAAGDLASRVCVETAVSSIEGSGQTETIPILAEAVQKANRAVLKKAAEKPEYAGMGTTIVAAVIDGNTLYVANVGDSRLYLIDDDRIDQITLDHSLVAEMVRSGRISPEQMRNHPEKNIITRAVGGEENVEVDFFDVGLHKGDVVLLCSDGLTNMVEDEQIFRIVRREKTLRDAGQKLISAANSAGGRDNISVVLARLTDL
ncbi:MAG TPA: Stp1/IreP family PP2C-type Ser/Thr phosphatase [Lachnospiraceae bacterium]|jgi:protein phosphatase|nr:Stp1/IreP family PP2C-type Ser/Thr phosphatase [Lachnospiraceae bacterium]HCG60145.1 Stp1/IreP family PP2C-type Ser/Thr phosphatase [Lachnospiraceae bacterium]HCI84557.1 Stp1/IreP family PP2C-type Ser/Thr phosphatase [Lachnospiraceae bacterium]